MTQDLLKKQQEIFKEQVDELYFIQKKGEERIKEFTTKQTELLEKSEKCLNEMSQEISSKLRDEAYEFEKARKWLKEDRAWNTFRSYWLYALGVLVFVATIINLWSIYDDLNRRPQNLYKSYKYTVEGKEVVIEPESIRKKIINGKEYTFAVVKTLP